MSLLSPSARGRRLLLRSGLAAAAIAAIALTAHAGIGGHAAARADVVAPAPVVAPDFARVAPAASYADLVARVAPSVVTVRSERVVRPVSQQLPLPDDPFLRRFFGEPFQGVPAPPHRQGGLGSAVIVSADGYLLTNHHVVDGAERIEVELADRRTFPATLVGSDAPSDLAVLKVDAPGLTPLPFGDSKTARVGDVVLAFGNPLGIGQTVTMGILSAKGRATDLGDGSFEDFLQTDAPINQGNSGGALVNTRGELIGINSQIVSPSGGNIGIGFAIPSEMARNVMGQLIDEGRVHRGKLGVTIQGVTSDIARSLGLDAVQGALVSEVSAGSPAEAAGLQRGDVILRVDGAPVTDANALRNRISSTTPGSEVELTVLRDDHERTFSVRLAELDATQTVDEGQGGQEGGGRLGLSVRPLSADEARQLGLQDRSGLLVAEVDPAGPAADSGFRPGDVIRQVDGKPISSASGLRAAVEAAGDRPALVLVARDGGSLFLTLHKRG